MALTFAPSSLQTLDGQTWLVVFLLEDELRERQTAVKFSATLRSAAAACHKSSRFGVASATMRVESSVSLT
jgi:hypothetical protein